MAQTTISININTPTGTSAAEAIRLFSTHHHYQTTVMDELGNQIPNPETRAAFAKRMLARQVAEAIRVQRRYEAEQAITLTGEITAD